MKKLFTLVLSCAISLNFYAQFIQSVSNGDWDNPATWSSNTIPFTADSVLINHNVTISADHEVQMQILRIANGKSLSGNFTFALHGDLIVQGNLNVTMLAVGDGAFTRNYGIITANNYASGNPTYKNYGAITCSEILTSGETNFENYGEIMAYELALSDGWHNFGSIEVSFVMAFDSGFTNHTGGIKNLSGSEYLAFDGMVNQTGAVIVAEYIVLSGMLINDGDITCVDLLNGEGTVAGNSGRFCISGSFQNAGILEGSIDICDSSPGGLMDFNFGTTGSGVTFCEAGMCSTTSNNELPIQEGHSLNVYPNPCANNGVLYFNSRMEPSATICIYNSSGELAGSFRKSNLNQLELSGLSSGLYFLVITKNNLTEKGLFVIE
jgi:hypothetical protein